MSALVKMGNGWTIENNFYPHSLRTVPSSEMRLWMNEMVGKWTAIRDVDDKVYIRFENEKDAVLYRLRW